ncbi:hypothetical protein [Streptomyces sp. NBC_00827]|uniref:hypothetical protein n=1 Tax=Streptomyces sp. NBC_00827 TaxID=2903677 RepID=UPI00386E8190|nr:hypothetical protein OG569_36900 [Streptomyces sp. NBC_00827]
MDTARGDVGHVCTKVAHQPLAVETGPDARLHFGARLVLLRLLFHMLSFGEHPSV